MSKEARFFYPALLTASLLCLGASHRTQSFIVTADTPQLAREIGETAEAMRHDLAIEWLGKPLPRWSDICPIRANISPQLGAGGATSFYFANNRPYGWQMTLQGSRERVLDSVLPHEITHTIFATHFGQPLPRWADEGACTTVEHSSEKSKQQQMLVTFLTTGRGIAFNQMFALREYPPDILPLYSQGFSLTRFLIAQGGKRKFVDYVGDGLRWNNWTAATNRHYGYSSLGQLQDEWLGWVKRGSPAQPDTMLASQPAVPVRNASTTAPPTASLASTSAGQAGRGSLFASPADSWYARQREMTRQQPGSQAGEDLVASRQPQDNLNESQSAVPIRSDVTRAPESGRPAQTVLPSTLESVPALAPGPSSQMSGPIYLPTPPQWY